MRQDRNLFGAGESVRDFLELLINGKLGGRPVTGPTPARQLGKIADEEWSVLKSAAERTGMTFTQWAVGVLLKEAKKVLRR